MNLDAIKGQDLEWHQPEALRRRYELSAGERTIGSVRFESGFGSLATAEFGELAWTFKRTGFFSPKITVRAAGSDVELAVFSPGWMGSGWLVFSSGRRYHLRHTNFWATEWVFEAEDGSAAVTLSPKAAFFKQGGKASLSAGAAGLEEAPILLLLIWYVRVLMNEDAAAARLPPS